MKPPIKYWKVTRQDVGREVGNPDYVKWLEEENRAMRQWMWLNHDHKGMYGDDGEMQCAMCYQQFGFWDWKRTPIKEILDRMIKAHPWFEAKGKEAQDEAAPPSA